MRLIIALLALFVTGGIAAHAAPRLTNAVATDQILMIDPSFMPVGVGKVTLIIGALRRADGVYTGDYRIKVFPYFLKNEKGRLAINVSDESLAEVSKGKVTAITGTATTSGKSGKNRSIKATATPADSHQGKLKLWFTAGSRQMVFEPAYHFVADGTTAVWLPMTTTNPAASRSYRMAASRPGGPLYSGTFRLLVLGENREAIRLRYAVPLEENDMLVAQSAQPHEPGK